MAIVIPDLLKLLTYLSFFSIVLTWYGLPLHIIRDVYLTLRSFITRIRDFIRYRRATAHMNSRYPDANAEEVEREGVCIICREEMRAWTEVEGGRAAGTQDQRSRPKKLPCGHVLHFSCLRSWLERQQRCPTCRRPVLDEPNTNTITGNNGPANPAGAGQAGIGFAGGNAGAAFGAQFGPLGFGPGFVQNLMERMNPQLQQQQQQQQQPQQQQGQLPPGQAENLPRAAAGATNNMQPDIEQHISRTRQLLHRELAMVEFTQRQLRQLEELRAQGQVADGGPQANLNAPDLGGPANVPATASSAAPGDSPDPHASTPNGLQGAHDSSGAAGLRPELRNLLSSASNTVPALSATGVNISLPPGMAIPPGWTVVPLAIPRIDGVSGFSDLSFGRGIQLRNRREQRLYQEWMTSYHARMTPGVERTREGAELVSGRPGMSRAVSAPADMIARQPEVIPMPIVPENVTARLSPAQIVELRPAVQHSVSIISSFIQYHMDQGQERHALDILCGLPRDVRHEILQGWPDRDIADVLANGTQDLLVGSQESRESLAAFHVGTLGRALPFEERIRLVFGLPKAPFRTKVLEQLHDERVNSELKRLEDSMDDLDENLPSVPTLLESISDWTEVPSLDEGSSREEVDRAERQTREITRQRIQILNDVSRAMRNAASKLERADRPPAISSQIPSQFNNEHELSLFGNQSVFDQNAQQGALSALEKEILDAEREWRHKARTVSGLLGSESTGEPSSRREGKGKQIAKAVTVEDAEE